MALAVKYIVDVLTSSLKPTINRYSFKNILHHNISLGFDINIAGQTDKKDAWFYRIYFIIVEYFDL